MPPPPHTLMIKSIIHIHKHYTQRQTDTHTHTHIIILYILCASHKHAITVHGYPLVSQERILLPGYICCFPPCEPVSRYHGPASHTIHVPCTCMGNYVCNYVCYTNAHTHTWYRYIRMYVCRSTLEPHSYALYQDKHVS